jgi:hypothetical protein
MSNSITDELAMAWIAWGLTRFPLAPDPTEIIRVVRVPFGDLLREIGTRRDPGHVYAGDSVAGLPYGAGRANCRPNWRRPCWPAYKNA